MRTETIFNAFDRVYRGVDWVIPPKRARQHGVFRAELIRRMADYDRLRADDDRGYDLQPIRGPRLRFIRLPQTWDDGTPLWG